MKSIVLLYHDNDARAAKVLAAALRRLVDLSAYEVNAGESVCAFTDRFDQIHSLISDAWAVIVVVGEQGVGDDFERLTRGAVQQRIVDQGSQFGRLVVRLPRAAPPALALRSWVSLEMEEGHDPASPEGVPMRILRALALQPTWSDGLNLEAARRHFAEGPDKEALMRHFSDVAQMLADGKPLTLMISPYAAVEGETGPDGCPSHVRELLLGMIQEPALRSAAGAQGGVTPIQPLPPLLWQDHLATLCLLSGRSRQDVSDAIEQGVREAAGDEDGTPAGQFEAIGAFVAQLMAAGLARKCAGLPAVTVLTVCPGLRMERALVAQGQPFERVTLLLDESGRPELQRKTYRPDPRYAARARSGQRNFMPDEQSSKAADEVEFVRLVKLFGSRDLDNGVPSGYLGQAYDLIGQLHVLLRDHVAAAESGPYLMLGGGLGTPPLQAAHAVLLRSALENQVRRPRLAIVPHASGSPDPLRQAETAARLRHITAVPNSGFDRLQIVSGDPVNFLQALTAAFQSHAVELAA